MQSKDLPEVFKEFVFNPNENSLLIDGPWGSGKTYQIQAKIKDLKSTEKKKRKCHGFKYIAYISLFGIQSIDEINTKLYCTTHKIGNTITQVVMKSSKIASKATINVLPQFSDAMNAINGTFCEFKKEKKRIKRTLIVLDDLERLSEKIKYSDLLGYYNSLLSSGCKRVAIRSSQYLESNGRLPEFNEFKEKVFDSVCVVNESPDEILDEILQDCNLKKKHSIYKEFGSNIRLAKKARAFYKTITDEIDNNSENAMLITNNQLFLYCAKAINNYFKEQKEEPVQANTVVNSTTKKLTASNPKIQIQDLFDKAYQEHNIKSLIPRITKNKKKLGQDKLLDENYFYLSDKNKKRYCEAFIAKLNDSSVIWDNKLRNVRAAILERQPEIINDGEIKLIAKKVVGCDDFEEEKRYCLANETIHGQIEFKEKLERYIKEVAENKTVNERVRCFESRNYSDRFDKVNKIKNLDKGKKDKFVSFLEENDYFFPNLSGDVNQFDFWYCENVAAFLKEEGKEGKFKDYANNICMQEPNNRSLKQKFDRLLKSRD